MQFWGQNPLRRGRWCGKGQRIKESGPLPLTGSRDNDSVFVDQARPGAQIEYRIQAEGTADDLAGRETGESNRLGDRMLSEPRHCELKWFPRFGVSGDANRESSRGRVTEEVQGPDRLTVRHE